MADVTVPVRRTAHWSILNEEAHSLCACGKPAVAQRDDGNRRLYCAPCGKPIATADQSQGILVLVGAPE